MRICGGIAGAAVALLVLQVASAKDFSVCRFGSAPEIIYEGQAESTLATAAELLAHDLKARCGAAPAIATDMSAATGPRIAIGAWDGPMMRSLLQENSIDAAPLKGAWERYGRVAVQDKNGQPLLLIFGSDTRGTVWGVIDLTRDIGVSAWEWWADVTIRPVDTLGVDGALRFSAPPTVRYRGLFLNDEDFGLLPWAAKTYEPEAGTIGPKTYARIFELMWRLKANTIWPAMHGATMSFNLVPGNAEMAARYAIVHGSSHAEPMLRTNLHEWDPRPHDAFNYLTNKAELLNYWNGAVAAHKTQENFYTVGLRGIHDDPMIGVKGAAQTRDVLADVIAEQRKILVRNLNRPAETIPQVFTPYKEVLAAYDAGLKVPDDITLNWPDDNHGYIRHLPDAAERARSGGSGIYYHVSYWGAPASYLWLATTHPALVWEEMNKAARMGVERLWVLNAGDIKPAEYLTQFFFDLAFDGAQYADIRTVREHLQNWVQTQFGPDHAAAITDVLWRYYDLANLRRPEFMGWSDTYPTTVVHQTAFNMLAYGDENARRLTAYRNLEADAQNLAHMIPADRRDAYFELVLYPVTAATAINERALSLDKAIAYGLQRRASANLYADAAANAQARIKTATTAYNTTLAGGKWRGMMDAAPHKLPVFAEPAVPHWQGPADKGCALQAEGGAFFEGGGSSPALPVFHPDVPASHYVDLFVKTAVAADWRAQSDTPWIVLDKTVGRFDPALGVLETRIQVSVDWRKVPKGNADERTGQVRLSCGGKTLPLRVQAGTAVTVAGASFAEVDRMVSIYAVHSDARTGIWDELPGLGQAGTALRSPLDMGQPSALQYRFVTETTNDSATLRVFALPTWPLSRANRLRVAVSIDDALPLVLDLAAAEFSQAWRANVLRNMAVAETGNLYLKAGLHRLKVVALDPGLVLDRFEIAFAGAASAYGPVPETRLVRPNR